MADVHDAVAGSFSGGKIVSAGAGYISGDICLQGNTFGGFGFNGTFEADPSNGSLVSFDIVVHGTNYSGDPSYAGLCFRGSRKLQVNFIDFCFHRSSLMSLGFTCRIKLSPMSRSLSTLLACKT